MGRQKIYKEIVHLGNNYVHINFPYKLDEGGGWDDDDNRDYISKSALCCTYYAYPLESTKRRDEQLNRTENTHTNQSKMINREQVEYKNCIRVCENRMKVKRAGSFVQNGIYNTLIFVTISSE